MSRFFILFVLAVLAALSLPSLCEADADKVRQHQEQRTVFGGERNKIDFTYDFAFHIGGDCSTYSTPGIQILKPPQHGKIELVSGYGYPPQGGEFEKCGGTGVLGLATFYTPDPGFTGRDSVTARFSPSNGYVTEAVYDIQVVEKPKLDPTCDALNQAYLKTHSVAQFKDNIYELKADGTRVPFSVVNGDPEKLVEIDPNTGRTLAYSTVVQLEDRDYPKFSSCRLLGRERTPEGEVVRYSTIWRKFPYSAAGEAWISAETGLILSFRRQYPDNGGQFPFRTALEVFDYSSTPDAADPVRVDP